MYTTVLLLFVTGEQFYDPDNIVLTVWYYIGSY